MEFEYRKSNCMVYRWRHRSESQTTIRQSLPADFSGKLFRQTLPADRLNIFIQQSQQSQPAKPFSKANKATQQSQQTNPAKPHS